MHSYAYKAVNRHPGRFHGFTLLELLVVLVIIGLLAGYVGPRYFAQLDKSEVKITHLQIAEFGKALDDYRIDIGHYPTSQQGLSALALAPAGEVKWHGPYLQHNVPLDPWGNPYQYRQPGQHGDYDLYSYGNSGQTNGTGSNTVIGNW